MNSKHSKYQENHTYTHHNKASENQDKETILKAVRWKDTFTCPVLGTEKVLQKYVFNKWMRAWVSVW